MKRGHPAEFCYIIFSGSVFVNIQDQDKDGRSFTRTECVMGEGSLFGVRCGTPVGEGSLFGVRCGTPVGEGSLFGVRCETPVGEGSLFGVRCGTPVGEGNGMQV